MDCIFDKVEETIERRYELVRLSDMYRAPLSRRESNRFCAGDEQRRRTRLDEPRNHRIQSDGEGIGRWENVDRRVETLSFKGAPPLPNSRDGI